MTTNRSLAAGEPCLNKPSAGSLGTLRIYYLTALLVTMTGILLKIRETYGLGSIWGFSGSTLLGLLPLYIYVLGLLGLIIFPGWRWVERARTIATSILRGFTRLGWINWVLFVLLITFYGYHFLAGVNLPVLGGQLQMFTFGHLSLLGALCLSGTGRVRPLAGLVLSFSIHGLIIWLLRWIPDVHTCPLSVGWSETSRFYYASLFFSPRIYGFRTPLSSLHPSRYLMQSLPFLAPALPLWAHRLWQVLLWIGMTLAGGLALKKRLHPVYPFWSWGIVAGFTLFVFQGPVYYHLMVVIVLVLLGFNKDKLGQSLLVVIIASLWAGISRVNWFPVAGMLAVTLYVLETPYGEKSFWQYWRWPVMAVLTGFMVAFSAQVGYAAISGKPPEVFASSFQSPLFSYRLFPNEAFGPGILLMLVFASLPAIMLILWDLLPRRRSWHPLRLLALVSILVALLIVGLIVSIKIGGGNNLHNLDAFLAFLAVIAGYVLFDRFSPDQQMGLTNVSKLILLTLLMVLIPLMSVLDNMQPYLVRDNDRAWEVIGQVQALIEQEVPEGGEVLFIQARHLITFGMIEGVKLVPEYEKVFLMEMAMSENENYLNNFKKDISSHRFDLIVTEPLTLEIKPATEVFGEENNAWAAHVTKPLDQYYQTVFESREHGITVMVPNPGQ